MKIYVADNQDRGHWRSILESWCKVQDQFFGQMGRPASSYDEPVATSIMSAAIWRSGRAAICEAFAWKGDPKKQYCGRTDLWFSARENVHEWVEAKSAWLKWLGKNTRSDTQDAMAVAAYDARRNSPDMHDENEPRAGIATAIVFFTALARAETWSAALSQADDVFAALQKTCEPTFWGMHRMPAKARILANDEGRSPCLSFIIGNKAL